MTTEEITGTVFWVFVLLKVTGQLLWSWWWITSPAWLPASAVLIAGILRFIVAVIFP